MPIHEYKCSSCGKISELLVGIGRNSDERVCRHCGAEDLTELMSASSISVNPELPGPMTGGSTCCGSNPSSRGCTPGSCCGAD